MSRHEIPGRDPNHTVVVGWDRPLSTFFVQVYDKRKAGQDGDIIRWWGFNPRELCEIDDVRRVIANFADLTADMASTLYGDRGKEL